ncbi:Hint domain-containing protein [Paracoccaceae bacterium Fryx2]|nr:Hint domain-containing protein [Paracoccaceae bacterium Fryx2]
MMGDEIGTYSGLSASGNNNGMKVELTGVQPLGSATDVFRVVVTQVNSGQAAFMNGQFVAIYAWPDTVPPSPPLYSSLNPQHDQFQGRASSSTHMIFTNQKVFFDLDGVTAGTAQFGPGLHPLRDTQLPFAALSPTPPAIPCFTAGTRLRTPSGMRAVETLRPGDPVLTLDHGAQSVRWIGARTVAGTGAFAPIRIAAGALGNRRALRLSPQHRVLLTDWRADLWFGSKDVLVAARHLVNGSTIVQETVPRVTYLHLAFDRHEVLCAEGIPCESLHLGRMGLAAMDAAQREELLALFPELANGLPAPTARPCLRQWEAGLLVA